MGSYTTMFEEAGSSLDFPAEVLQAIAQVGSSMSPRYTDVDRVGLMAIPRNAIVSLRVTSVFDPMENVLAATALLRSYRYKLGEIPDAHERLLLSLWCYWSSLETVMGALRAARESEGLEGDYRRWRLSGKRSGRWQTYEYASSFVRRPQHPLAEVWRSQVALTIAYAALYRSTRPVGIVVFEVEYEDCVA